MKIRLAGWILAAALGGIGVTAGVAAQMSQKRPMMTPTEPKIVSGPDVGFRVEGVGRKGEPVGRLVLRVNGEWVEAADSWTVGPAAQ